MKYYKRLKVYKGSNVKYIPEATEAYSYDHWLFVKKINDKIVFNWYFYSQSTRQHQYKVKSLLDQLGVEVDFTVNSRLGLDYRNCLALEIENILNDCKALLDKINTKGTRKNKNLERQKTIMDNIDRIDEILNFNRSIDYHYNIESYLEKRFQDLKDMLSSQILYNLL